MNQIGSMSWGNTARIIIESIPRTHSNLDSYLSGRNITRPDDAVSANIGSSRACP